MTREEFIGLMAEGRARDMEQQAEQAHRLRVIETARLIFIHCDNIAEPKFAFEAAEQFEAAADEYRKGKV